MGDSRVPELEPVASPPQRDLDYYDLQLSEEPLGEGGQTVVYKASVPGSEPPETVAVRQLGDREFDKSVEWGENGDYEPFFEQAKTWASLSRRERTEPRWRDSDHIVGIVALGDNLPWAALEYMDGGSLAERLDGTDGLPTEEAVWIGERLCRGLQVAHNTGVAHLDLKPGNILFRKTPTGTWDVPKIADWGLARNLLDDTSASMDVLSTRYAAPEQFDREEFGRPGTATDIYQLGAVLYALLTGDPPYTGAERSVMFDIVNEQLPPAPSQRRSELSRKLDAVIQAALEARKSDRYDSIAQFKRALRALRVDEQLSPVVDQRVPTSDSASNTQTDGQTLEGQDKIKESDSVARWAMFGFGPARKGAPANQTGPNAPVTARWQLDTPGRVQSSPAVVDSTVYVGSADGSLYAAHVDTGYQEWQFDTDGHVDSSPAVADGTVYVGSWDNCLYAVDAATGDQQWQFDTSGSVYSSPAVADGTVYVGSWDHYVYGVDTDTGEEQWLFHTSGSVWSSPVVVDGTVYVGSDDGKLYAVDAATRNKRWQFDTSGYVRSSPAVVDDTVYVGSDDGNLYAVDAATGNKRWQFDTNGSVRSSPVVVDGTVYVGSHSKNLYAVDAATGTKQWQFYVGEQTESSPAVAGNTVYIGSADDNLYAIDAATSRKQWQFNTSGQVRSSPAVVDGTVYVGSGRFIDDSNSLYAVEHLLA